MPRTPYLLAWDTVPPPMDALRCFGLSKTDDVPLLVDSPGHIRGLVTREVSTQIIHFYLQNRTRLGYIYVHKHISRDFTEQIYIKFRE